MTLYNATASAVIQDAETPVTLLTFSDTFGRARLTRWDVSFDGLIAGNNMTVSLYLTDATGGTVFQMIPPMDGEDKFVDDGPFFASEPGTTPLAVADQLDLVNVADSAYYKKQYAKGREPIFGGSAVTGGMLCATVTPSALVVPVRCKMNLTFAL